MMKYGGNPAIKQLQQIYGYNRIKSTNDMVKLHNNPNYINVLQQL